MREWAWSIGSGDGDGNVTGHPCGVTVYRLGRGRRRCELRASDGRRVAVQPQPCAARSPYVWSPQPGPLRWSCEPDGSVGVNSIRARPSITPDSSGAISYFVPTSSARQRVAKSSARNGREAKTSNAIRSPYRAILLRNRPLRSLPLPSITQHGFDARSALTLGVWLRRRAWAIGVGRGAVHAAP
jgi:hypothetical protein